MQSSLIANQLIAIKLSRGDSDSATLLTYCFPIMQRWQLSESPHWHTRKITNCTPNTEGINLETAVVLFSNRVKYFTSVFWRCVVFYVIHIPVDQWNFTNQSLAHPPLLQLLITFRIKNIMRVSAVTPKSTFSLEVVLTYVKFNTDLLKGARSIRPISFVVIWTDLAKIRILYGYIWSKWIYLVYL